MTLGDRLVADLEAIASELTAAGVPASINAGEVEVPGAWVHSRELYPGRTLAGGATLVVHVYLIAPDSDDETEALKLLAGLLAKALPVCPVDPESDYGQPIDTGSTVQLPHTPGTILPAFRLVTERDI